MKATLPGRSASETTSGPAGSEALTRPRSRPSAAGGALDAVRVPAPYAPIFRKAQDYVEKYFGARCHNPRNGSLTYSGERYILVRAGAMSEEFFDLVVSLYQDRDEGEARRVAGSLLFDLAHAIGKADARNFCSRMGVSSPLEKLSAGPVLFAYTGWAFVEILPDSHPTPDENYYLIYDHPFSFEADAWMRSGKRPGFPVCVMSAGYSSGWCEESFGLPLVAAEIQCQALGNDRCRFIMAPPNRLRDYVERYHRVHADGIADPQTAWIPEFFQRKRLQDEQRRQRDILEKRVRERTARITGIMEDLRKREGELQVQSRNLEEANIALKVVLRQMEAKTQEEKEHILASVKQLVLPYLSRLKSSASNPKQQTLINILESNLERITSPLVGRLSSRYLNLTPTEIRVADLIRQGLTSKEIAEMLGISPHTIASHRYKVRSKLGLRNQGTNLRSHLLSLSD